MIFKKRKIENLKLSQKDEINNLTNEHIKLKKRLLDEYDKESKELDTALKADIKDIKTLQKKHLQ